MCKDETASTRADVRWQGRSDGIVVRRDGPRGWQPLELRLDLAEHAPRGFGWGRDSRGALQLALALCADLLEDDSRALDVHEAVKWRLVILFVHGEPWELTVGELADTIAAVEASDDHLDAQIPF